MSGEAERVTGLSSEDDGQLPPLTADDILSAQLPPNDPASRARELEEYLVDSGRYRPASEDNMSNPRSILREIRRAAGTDDEDTVQ